MSRFRGILMASACLGLIAAMPSFAGQSLFVGSALAKDGGNGGGHGNGNGHSGGSEGKSGSQHGDSSNDDKSSRAKAFKQAVSVVESDDTDQLGALNAAHASARARERASPKSAVGKVATYERAREQALAITDPAQRELALDAAVDQLDASFGRTLTSAQISKVNALLDAD